MDEAALDETAAEQASDDMVPTNVRFSAKPCIQYFLSCEVEMKHTMTPMQGRCKYRRQHQFPSVTSKSRFNGRLGSPTSTPP